MATPNASLDTTNGPISKEVNQTDTSSTFPPNSNPIIDTHNTNSSINPSIEKMKSSRPLSPLPIDCIKQMYSGEVSSEGTVAHLVLEKSKGFSY